MCQKCGCNTCESIRGPLLTESRVKKLVSENLQYHINENIPLMESVFRIGSDAHLAIIKEARKLYSRNVLDLCEEDEGIIKTHLGEFGMYEGEKVPLDLPMLTNVNLTEAIRIPDPTSFADPDDEEKEQIEKITNDLRILLKDLGIIKENEGEIEAIERTNDLLRVMVDVLKNISKGGEEREKELKDLDKSIDFLAGALSGQSPLAIDISQDVLGRLAGAGTNDKLNEIGSQLNEKKKAKKDPPIGKPKRGGPKAYYVYVRDPKTKRIKKVTFGSGGLRAKIRNPKARKAFAARHKCSTANDRTTARYWSCRLPRYAKQLGLGANMNTFW
tara:strand:- start:784 stop:1773 length:990 start_codon:yes stop_codon:yes gene_type:complete